MVAIGTALAHPPKSSSAATVGAGLDTVLDAAGAPQPAPMSLAVNVSGTFIIEAAVEEEGAAGAGSGVLHALLPQGSIFAENILVTVDVVADTSGFGAGGGSGLERLKAELKSCCVDVQLGGCGAGFAAGGGELASPNGSLDTEDDGGGFGFAGADLKLENPKSRPLEEIDEVRGWGLGRGGLEGVVRLSNRLPPLMEEVREVTWGAAGVDLALVKGDRFAKGDGFSVGFCGGCDGVLDGGKLSPLKASVNPPKLDDDVDWAGSVVRSPKEDVRSCCTGAGGFE